MNTFPANVLANEIHILWNNIIYYHRTIKFGPVQVEGSEATAISKLSILLTVQIDPKPRKYREINIFQIFFSEARTRYSLDIDSFNLSKLKANYDSNDS